MPLPSLACFSIFTVLPSISTSPACISELSLPHCSPCALCLSLSHCLSVWMSLPSALLSYWSGSFSWHHRSISISCFFILSIHPSIPMLIWFIMYINFFFLSLFFCFPLQTTHHHSLKHLEKDGYDLHKGSIFRRSTASSIGSRRSNNDFFKKMWQQH